MKRIFFSVIIILYHFFLFESKSEKKIILIPYSYAIDFQIKITLPNMLEETAKISLESPISMLGLSNNNKVNSSYGEIGIKNTRVPIDYSYSTQYSKYIITFALNAQNRSLIPQMYESNKIDKKIFSILPRDEQIYSGYLYIGGFPSNIEGKLPYGECDALFNKWACKLEEVYFDSYYEQLQDNYVWNRTGVIYFSLDISRKIYAPKAYMEMLINSLFKGFFSNETCKIIRKQIECYGKSFYDNFPDTINIKIDGYVYSLPKQSLFDRKENFYYFIITEPNERYDSHSWVFGYRFISQFTTTFDMDKKKIMFFTDLNHSFIQKKKSAQAERKGNNMNILILTLYLIIVSILIFGIVLYNLIIRERMK